MSALRPNVLIIGAGHYVTGTIDGHDARTDKDTGVFLPSVLAMRDQGFVHGVWVVGRRGTATRKAVDVCAARLGIDAESILTLPKGSINDETAYAEALRTLPKPLIALIATPDHTHREVIEACIDEAVPFLVVKPALRSLDDHYAVVRRMEEENAFGLVDFHKIYDDANALIRQHLSNQSLGDIYTVLAIHTQRRIMRSAYSRWRMVDRELNVLDYLGSHSVHMVNHWTAARPTGVRASESKADGPDAVGDMIRAIVSWKLPDGRPFESIHIAGWCDADESPSMSDQRFVVWGSQGRIESDQGRRGIEVSLTGVPTQSPNPHFFGTAPRPGLSNALDGKYGFESVKTFVQAAILHLEGKRSEGVTALPTIGSMGPVTAVLEAAAKSRASGGRLVPIALHNEHYSVGRLMG